MFGLFWQLRGSRGKVKIHMVKFTQINKGHKIQTQPKGSAWSMYKKIVAKDNQISTCYIRSMVSEQFKYITEEKSFC